MTRRIIGMALHVRDLERSVDVYTRILGLREVRRNSFEGMEEATLSMDGTSDGTVVVLAQLAAPAGSPPGPWGRVVVAVDDVHGVTKQLLAEGCSVGEVRELTTHRVSIAIAADPDGHALELVQLP